MRLSVKISLQTYFFFNLFPTLLLTFTSFLTLWNLQGLFPPGQGATIGVDFMIKTVEVENEKVKVYNLIATC